MSKRTNRWELLGFTKPTSFTAPGSTDPIDLLMFAASSGAGPADDPVRAMLNAVEDELDALAAALADEIESNGYGGAARALAFRVRAARLLFERADDIDAGERPRPEPRERGTAS